MFVRDFAIQRLAQLEKQVSRNQYGVRLPAEKEAEKYEEQLRNVQKTMQVVIIHISVIHLHLHLHLLDCHRNAGHGECL